MDQLGPYRRGDVKIAEGSSGEQENGLPGRKRKKLVPEWKWDGKCGVGFKAVFQFEGECSREEVLQQVREQHQPLRAGCLESS